VRTAQTVSFASTLSRCQQRCRVERTLPSGECVDGDERRWLFRWRCSRAFSLLIGTASVLVLSLVASSFT
jgi:hypothetical protein